MTAARWLGLRSLLTLALVSALALGSVGLIELVERARSGGAALDLLALVGWRLPLLLRELLPALAAVAAAAVIAGLRRRGELLGLAAAGASPGVVTLAVTAALGAAGAGAAVGLELLAPVALDRSAEAEAALTGESLKVDGQWAVIDGGASVLRIGAVERDPASGGALADVTLVIREEGRMVERWDAARLSWDGERWIAEEGRVTRLDGDLAAVDGPSLLGEPRTVFDFVPPEELGVLTRRQATSELGALSLRRRGDEASRRWWWWRGFGGLTPLVLAGAAAAWTVRTPSGPALAVAAAAAAAAALTLTGLALAEAGAPGAAPAAVVLVGAALVGGAWIRRPCLSAAR